MNGHGRHTGFSSSLDVDLAGSSSARLRIVLRSVQLTSYRTPRRTQARGRLCHLLPVIPPTNHFRLHTPTGLDPTSAITPRFRGSPSTEVLKIDSRVLKLGPSWTSSCVYFVNSQVAIQQSDSILAHNCPVLRNILELAQPTVESRSFCCVPHIGTGRFIDGTGRFLSEAEQLRTAPCLRHLARMDQIANRAPTD